mgnify:CR=1 FL=1
MGCRSDYMEATSDEKAFSQVQCLLDELDGKKFDSGEWRGYHRDVYNVHLSKEQKDKLVSSLCSKLQKLDVSKYSLEMQMWWRDHKIADKERLDKEMADLKNEQERQEALSKLTPHEKQLLGIK